MVINDIACGKTVVVPHLDRRCNSEFSSVLSLAKVEG